MAAKTEPSISELVGKVISDAQRLAMAQLALAKDEIGKGGFANWRGSRTCDSGS